MQYRKLIRQYGRAVVIGALTQANTILRERAERRSYRTGVDQRMVRFHGRQPKVDKQDPTLLASYYIPAVALTRLLASPGWKALALNPVATPNSPAAGQSTTFSSCHPDRAKP